MKTINLNGEWKLSPAAKISCGKYTSFFENHDEIPITLPGDVHSALLDNKIITDPYWREQEAEVQWVGQMDWVMKKSFLVTREDIQKKGVLELVMADTMITIILNGRRVGNCFNMFRRWRFDVSDFLLEGKNTIELHFESAEAAAKRENESLPYPIPYTQYPIYSPHRNLIRKTQCHSGWDWGPCIMAFGVYDHISLEFIERGKILSFNILTEKKEEDWSISAEIEYETFIRCEESFSIAVMGEKAQTKKILEEGVSTIKLTINGLKPELWYPNGYGEQVLYECTCSTTEESITKRVGFRTLELKHKKEADGGVPMTFSINGIDIFAKGGNWIPTDALISRQSDEKTDYLLTSMVKANMNMVRLWGGGEYEREHFYDKCDELGLLIWHDMMFACSMYPATEKFLDNVDKEIRYQIKRLKTHPSIALWCGNNEDLGAINWYEETRNNPERYIADYEKLNNVVVCNAVEESDPSRTFWPSSPSAGKGDNSDNWHSDNKGDMHYWSVWHEGKPFEAYYDIRPRFVSEFGYQSFPMMSTVRTYAEEDDFNLTSPVMEHHQKNDRGNTIILENFSRYFRLPSSFENSLYLSQVQQTLAMKTAIEYYHSLMPHCMGTLYWQINDNYPVASWSSIDYEGRWKLLHYAAKRFYSPISLSSYFKDGKAHGFIINDTINDVERDIHIEKWSFAGKLLSQDKLTVQVDKGSSKEFFLEDKPEEVCFYRFAIEESESTLIFDLYKRLPLENPEIKTSMVQRNKDIEIQLTASKPAFFVSLDTPYKGLFSDNCFDMLPGEERVITFHSEKDIDIHSFIETLKVYNLYSQSR